MPAASISSTLTQLVGDYGIYAVFFLMLIDAVFPAGSEIVMVYGGAIASGAIVGADVTLFGSEFESGLPAYLAIVAAGTIGYLIGSVIGWEIGMRGGRPFLERRGKWFHLDHERLERAEAWFQRWGDWAVFLGRLTPVVRSFVSIPAGVFGMPFWPYVWLTAIGSAIWAFALAGIGYAFGSNYERFHHAFDLVLVAGAALLALYLVFRWFSRLRSRRA